MQSNASFQASQIPKAMPNPQNVHQMGGLAPVGVSPMQQQQGGLIPQQRMMVQQQQPGGLIPQQQQQQQMMMGQFDPQQQQHQQQRPGMLQQQHPNMGRPNLAMGVGPQQQQQQQMVSMPQTPTMGYNPNSQYYNKSYQGFLMNSSQASCAR